MGQEEVLNWFKNKRAEGVDKFFTIPEVKQDFPDMSKGPFWRCVQRLFSWGYLDIQLPTIEERNYINRCGRKFRLKDEFVRKK